MALLDDALALAAQGLPVFPCGEDKRPITASGFYDASTDPAEVRRMFSKPGAALIGTPAGIPTRCVVIDVDVKDGGLAWYEDHRGALPETRAHRTRSGGIHLIFAHPLGDLKIGNRARVFPGVDVRGDGGYIIAPPSPGYSVASDAPMAQMPEWLLNAILRRPEPAPSPSASPARLDRYTTVALDNETRAVASASEGSRNDTLNRAAFNLGTLCGAGHLSRREAEARLLAAALTCGLDAREAQATIKSGLDSGERSPRRIEERVTHNPQAQSHDWENSIGRSDRDIGRVDRAEEEPSTPVLWVDEEAFDAEDIPARPWLAPGFLMRGAVTLLTGPGSAGKSSLVIAWATNSCLGRQYGQMRPAKPLKWVIYNTEDDRQEQRRRIAAALIPLGKTPHEVSGRIVRCGPAGVGTLIDVDAVTGGMRFTRAWEAIEALIREHKPDVLALDPLVELHSADENDNTALRAVVARLRTLAQEHDISILLLHHSRKGAMAGDMDGARGASSIVGAVRVHLTVATMTKEEAEALGQPAEHRRLFFRVDGAKSNYAPATEAAWHELQPYDLPSGDIVAAALPWAPPNVSVTPDHEAAALRCLRDGFQGEPLSEGNKAAASFHKAFAAAGIPKTIAAKTLDNLKARHVVFTRPWRKRGEIHNRLWTDGNTLSGWENVDAE